MPEGPEPTGWELLRMIDNARGNIRKDIADLETGMASKEWVRSEIQRVLDNIKANSDRIEANTRAIELRVQQVEAQKAQSAGFRRAIILAAITVLLTSAASIIITLIHAASSH